MKRILLRAGKSPFEVLSAEETFERRPMGDNIGNFMFAHSAHRILSAKGTKVDVVSLSFKKLDPDFINKHYDTFVLPLANVFRTTAIPYLKRLTKILEKLTIPVVILGVGIQAPLGKWEKDKELDKEVIRFMKAALARGPSVGVRGHRTAAYLKSLGFKKIDVIGCPSLFRFGPDLKIEKKVDRLEDKSPISFSANFSNYPFSKTVRHNINTYPNLTYLPQDLKTLDFMLHDDVEGYPGYHRTSSLPLHPKHRIFRDDKALFFTDVIPWLRYLSERDFLFSDRIHACVAAILAGTPTFLIAPDLRTLELAEYFDIPHMTLENEHHVLDAAYLYEKADFSTFNKKFEKRFRTFEAFLQKHGLEHALYDKRRLAAYDRKLESLVYPDPVRSITASQIPNVLTTFTRRVYNRLLG